MRIKIDGMRGLGDNIYMSAFVRTLAVDNEIHVTTPWPELYGDIAGVKFQRCSTNLRTQAKNMSRLNPEIWSYETHFDKCINVHYGAGTNIADDFRRIFGCDPTWGMPEFKGLTINKPYIVVRPATLRKEWFAASRNPKPEYIAQVVEWLKKKYYIISVADFQDGQEWAEGALPYADEMYHAGELAMPELLGLCQGAAGIVGGVGWIVPFAVSAGIPAFIIMGGCGEYNAPWKITNDTMDLQRLHFASPENLCMCRDMKHNCNKEITNLKELFNEWQQVL